MSLIDQARDLVRGLVTVEPGGDPAAIADDPGTRAADEVWHDPERIRAEWESQPHHP